MGQMENEQFEEKRWTGKYNGAESRAQGDKTFKEQPDAKWKKGSHGLRERPHQAKLQSCEKESRETLSKERSKERKKEKKNKSLQRQNNNKNKNKP